MIYMTLSFIGAVWGALYVRKGGGNRFDMAQYAAVWAVLGFMIGLFLTIIVDRLF